MLVMNSLQLVINSPKVLSSYSLKYKIVWTQANKSHFSICKDQSGLNFCFCLSPAFYCDKLSGTDVTLYHERSHLINLANSLSF